MYTLDKKGAHVPLRPSSGSRMPIVAFPGTKEDFDLAPSGSNWFWWLLVILLIIVIILIIMRCRKRPTAGFGYKFY